MFGLGKKRSKFGKWLDKEDITQLELENATQLSRGTVSKLCNDSSYTPKISTIKQIMQGLSKLGKNVRENEFWDM